MNSEDHRCSLCLGHLWVSKFSELQPNWMGQVMPKFEKFAWEAYRAESIHNLHKALERLNGRATS